MRSDIEAVHSFCKDYDHPLLKKLSKSIFLTCFLNSEVIILFIRMKFGIFLVLLVGFASSTKLKLDSVESVDDILALKPPTDVEREKRSVKFSTPAAGTCFKMDGSFRWKANCNFPQHDHSRIAAHKLADCLTACSKNAKCTHFTYNIATKTCYQKHSNVNLKDEPAEEGICGLKNAVSPAKLADNGLGRNCWNSNEGGLSSWGAHCKFDGQKLNSFSTQKFANCRVECKNNQQCTHFNYDYVNKMCYLIRATIHPLTETSKDNFYCGLINQRPVQSIPKCWSTEQKPLSTRVTYKGDKCHFPGGEFKNYKTSNLTDCRISCSKDKKCTHFTLNVLTNLCFLQQSTKPFAPKWAEHCFCGFVADPNVLVPKCT